MAYMSGLICALLVALSSVKAVEHYVRCGACHVIAEEVGMAMAGVDPAKKIQVGSFRVDPKGNQNLNEVSYARSDVHLTEVLETVCDKTKEYIQSKSKAGNLIFVPQNRKDGGPQVLNTLKVDQSTTKLLKFACETLVEEYEEDIVKSFKNPEVAGVEQTRELCVDHLGVCKEGDVYDMHAETALDPAMQKLLKSPKKKPQAVADVGGGSDDSDEDDDDHQADDESNGDPSPNSHTEL